MYFNKTIAEKYGLNEAILLNHFYFWMNVNKNKNKISTHYHENNWWFYETIENLHRYFKFLSKKQIRYAIDNLHKKNIIKIGNWNKLSFDRTKWYTVIDEETLYLLEIDSKDKFIEDDFMKDIDE